MGHSFTLELCLCLTGLPVILQEIPKMHIHSLGYKRTRADQPVTGCQVLVLPMTLVKDNSMSYIHLLNGCKLNVLEDRVEQKLKVLNGDFSPIKIVRSSDRIKIRNSWSDLSQY